MELRRLNIGCFGGRHRSPQTARRTEDQSLAAPERGRDHVRQRRQLGATPRRARRTAAGGRAALRAGDGAQRARSAPAAAGAAADARTQLGGHTGGNLLLSMMERYSGDFLAAVRRAAIAARREGARCGRSASSPASLCAQYGDGSTTSGEVEVDAGQSAGHQIARLWLEPWVNLHPAAAEAIAAVRRGDHRARQLLHQPDADLPGARRARGDPAGARPDRAGQQPADRRARHVALHRRRGGARDERHHRPAHRRRRRQHLAAVGGHAGALPRGAQAAARRSATCRRIARS